MQLKIPTYCLSILVLFALFYPHREHRAVLVEKSAPKLLTGLLLVPTVATISLFVAFMPNGQLSEWKSFDKKMAFLFFLATACLLYLIYLTLQRGGNLPAKHTAYLLLLLPAVAVIIPFLIFVANKEWIYKSTTEGTKKIDPKMLALALLTGFSSISIIVYAFTLGNLIDKKRT